MHAIRISETGGPEVMSFEEVDDPTPAGDGIVVKVGAAGVNYIDTYHRSGLYEMSLPLTLGLEGSGTVSAVGGDVTQWSVGDKVAWTGAIGSYAEQVAMPAASAVAVPEAVGDDVAAASMLQGLTAHYLVDSTYPLGEGDKCVVHAAAGGVGLLLVQMAKMKGAEVFATVGTDEKADLARGAGADHVIMYRDVDFATVVEDIAGTNPIDVVYDGVGATTFDGGLRVLRRRGTMATFGNASGPVEPVTPIAASAGNRSSSLGQACSTISRSLGRCRPVPMRCSAGSHQERSTFVSVSNYRLQKQRLLTSGSKAARRPARYCFAPRTLSGYPNC